MAKSKKSKGLVIYRHKSSNRALACLEKFVYEVEIHLIVPGKLFCLYDTVNVKLDQFKKEQRYTVQKTATKVVTHDYTLKAAPKQWLTENNYLQE